MYYLKLTGTIKDHNRLEFEQTYRLFCPEIPASCSGYFISKDVLYESVYHFISYWPFMESLESFVQSAIYNTLVGSFKTLGELREKSSAKLTSCVDDFSSRLSPDLFPTNLRYDFKI